MTWVDTAGEPTQYALRRVLMCFARLPRKDDCLYSGEVAVGSGMGLDTTIKVLDVLIVNSLVKRLSVAEKHARGFDNDGDVYCVIECEEVKELRAFIGR